MLQQGHLFLQFWYLFCIGIGFFRRSFAKFQLNSTFLLLLFRLPKLFQNGVVLPALFDFL